MLSGLEELLRAFEESGEDMAPPAQTMQAFLALHYGGARAASAVATTLEKSMPGSEKGASMSLQLVILAMKYVKERVHSSRTRREMSSRPKMSRNE